ncbi:FAD-dependent oxidoreductase [Prauserella cavernicola]|uniref:FAD-dependent oxidoreductase n=1 Tax=Prauserella cavernicola TaxID=2800127 RepID=A0A934V8Z5_9PSEU|nr:FAD-dependent oxidoreductase [Prauserella cavernicola]MBK1789189.1 FAD-dependent oxidoreductase [Prauserella cavernicola]
MTGRTDGHPAPDVVIVGAGTAGLPAAIEAAEHGLRVTVVEQADQVGGTLWRSWAQLSAGGTELQRRKGILDSPRLHFEDAMRISKQTADPELVRLAVEHAPATVDWLMNARFDIHPDAPAILHFHEPYSIPRTYWGRNAGRSVLEVLLPRFERACADGAIDLRLHTTMTALRKDGAQRIAGVTLRTPDGTTTDLDAAAVILTTGGYSGNAELFPALTRGAPLVGPGSPTSTGRGILAATDVGAQVRGQDLFLPTYGGVLLADSTHETEGLDDYPSLTPQQRPPWEIHVNRHGTRFVAEDSHSVDVRETALLEQPRLEFWIIYDEAIRRAAPPLLPTWSDLDLEAAFDRHPSFARAGDVGALAAAAGIDANGLRATVAAYNDAVESGGDEFGRRHFPAPIGTPPFYAVRNHGTTLKSPAGLAVDHSLRVLGSDGAFANLYAAGEAIGGSSMSGKSFVSGMSVTPALSFGRMLGRKLAGEPHDPGSM